MSEFFTDADVISAYTIEQATEDGMNQSLAIVRKKSNNFKDHDWFFEGEIELPSGNRQQVFIEQNETGKYTILLPSDH